VIACPGIACVTRRPTVDVSLDVCLTGWRELIISPFRAVGLVEGEHEEVRDQGDWEPDDDYGPDGGPSLNDFGIPLLGVTPQKNGLGIALEVEVGKCGKDNPGRNG
jgi:hypothetical protein